MQRFNDVGRSQPLLSTFSTEAPAPSATEYRDEEFYPYAPPPPVPLDSPATAENPYHTSPAPAKANGAGGSSAPAQRPSDRPVFHRSCEPCKRRKIKCDRVKPCVSCVLRGTETACYTDEAHYPELASSTSAAAAPSYYSDTPAAMRAPSPVRTSGELQHSAQKRKRFSADETSLALRDAEPRKRHADPKSRQAMLIRQQMQILKTSLSALESMLVDETDYEPSNGIGEAAPPSRITRDLLDEERDNVPISGAVDIIEIGADDVMEISPYKVSDYADHRTDAGMIVWHQLEARLPPVQDCDRMLAYFFEELIYQVSFLHVPTFEAAWERFKGGQSCPRTEAAAFLMLFAIVGLMLPSAHQALDSYEVSPKRLHARFYRMAFEVLEGGRDPLSRPDGSYMRVIVDALAMMYTVFAGLHDLAWQQVGRTARRAEGIHLFDESHRAWLQLSDLKKEYRRRLAYSIVIVDRWQCWHFMRSWAIIPSFFNVSPPLFDSDDTYDPETGARDENAPMPPPDDRLARLDFGDFLVQAFLHLRSLPSIPPEERYANARTLDALLERNLISSLRVFNATIDDVVHMRIEETKESHRKFAQAIVWYSSSFHIRCTIMRPFLEDEGAPADLRFVSLLHARRVIESMPLVKKLTCSPWVPFQASWNSTHLLSASATFAIPFLSAEYDEASATSASSASGGTPDSTTGGSNGRPKHKWPRRDLDWFASKIFETLETLRFLGVQGNHTARVSEKLLQGLCTSRMQLKERYAQKRAEDHVQRERNSAVATLMNVRNASEQGKESAEEKLAASRRGHPVSSDRSMAGSASAKTRPSSSGAEHVSGSVAARSQSTTNSSSNGHTNIPAASNGDAPVASGAAAALDASNSTWTSASWQSIAQMAPFSLSSQPHWLHANPSQQSAMPFGLMPLPASQNGGGSAADANGGEGGGDQSAGVGTENVFGPSITFLDSLMMSEEEWAELTFGLDSSPESASARAARNLA